MLKASIGFKDIHVAPAVFDAILNLELHREVGRHTKLSLRGYISADNASKIPQTWGDNQTITLAFPPEEGQDPKPRFVGVVTDYTLGRNARSDMLSIEAIGMSHMMDVARHNRSFQSEEMTFEELAQYLLLPYRGSDLLDFASSGMAVKDFLIQYEETDWEFLQRAYSRINAPLIPDDVSKGPRLQIGFSKTPGGKFDTENYSMRRKILDFRKKSENGLPEKIGQGSMELLMQSGEWLNLGMPYIINGLKLYVSSAISRIENGILLHDYTLCDENGLMASQSYNPAICGLSLLGKVTEVSKDSVRIALGIDTGNSACGNRLFPYSTVYSTPDGAGWYCMPEVGDTVTLYISDHDENNGYIRSSVNIESPSRTNPDTKELSTRYGKKLRFTPGGIEIIAGEGLHVRLMNNGGVVMNSPRNISIKAGGDIEITSGDQISISGDKGVYLKQEGANISLKDDVLMSGDKVLTQK